MQNLPINFLKLNQISTNYKLYDMATEVLYHIKHCKKQQIQIYYKGYKIPFTKEHLSIDIPKIGYGYGDNFEFQKLNDNIPPRIEIKYNDKKKTLKLNHIALSKKIIKSDIIHILSKLLHTSSQNIESLKALKDQQIFALKKGSLYEIDFIDFNKYSRETEYYCFNESSSLMELQEFVARRHGLYPSQIEYIDYEDTNDQDRALNSFPNEKIFCFRTLDSKEPAKDSDSKYELSVAVDINDETFNFTFPFNSRISDLRNKIMEHISRPHEKSYFGIIIENEFVSDEKKLTHFLIEPNKLNKVYTIQPEEQKRCDLFLFKSLDKNVKKKKDVLYLMNINMKCSEVQQFLFRKSHSKVLLHEGKVIEPDCTLENIILDKTSIQEINYRNSQTKYFYKVEKEGEVLNVEIESTKRIIDFLNQIDIIHKLKPKNSYIVVNFVGNIIPFWEVLLNYPTTEENYFQIETRSIDSVRKYKIKEDKLVEFSPSNKGNFKLYSAFTKVPKGYESLYYPYNSCFTLRKKKSHPMIITYVRSECLKYEYQINTKEDKKKSAASEQIGIFGLLDDNFQLKYKNGNEYLTIPPDFSIKSLPNKSEIIIEAETDQNCYSQLFYTNTPKEYHYISYDKTTTIEQAKEMLQKEFELYYYPSDTISFYFNVNKINDLEKGQYQKLKEFFISNCINPKTLIKVQIDKSSYMLKEVKISAHNKEQSYYFKEDDTIQDVKKRLENQYNAKIRKIKDLNTNTFLNNNDKITSSLKILFGKTKVMIPESTKEKKFEKIVKAGAAIKKLTKSSKIAKDYSYKFNPKYLYKIFVPGTSMYINSGQRLSQLPKYEVFRCFRVKLSCDYLDKYHVEKLYNENLTIVDVYKDLRPLVKNKKYELIMTAIPKQNYDKKLCQIMANKNEIEAIIVQTTNNSSRRRSISHPKVFNSDDFNSSSKLLIDHSSTEGNMNEDKNNEQTSSNNNDDFEKISSNENFQNEKNSDEQVSNKEVSLKKNTKEDVTDESDSDGNDSNEIIANIKYSKKKNSKNINSSKSESNESHSDHKPEESKSSDESESSESHSDHKPVKIKSSDESDSNESHSDQKPVKNKPSKTKSSDESESSESHSDRAKSKLSKSKSDSGNKTAKSKISKSKSDSGNKTAKSKISKKRISDESDSDENDSDRKKAKGKSLKIKSSDESDSDENDSDRKKAKGKSSKIKSSDESESDSSESNSGRKKAKGKSPKIKSSDESDSDENDSDHKKAKGKSSKIKSSDESDSSENDSDRKKAKGKSPKIKSSDESDSSESNSDRKKAKGKSPTKKKTIETDSDSSSAEDEDDDKESSDEEQKYKFLFSDGNKINLPLPKGSTINDAKKRIAEYLNDNKESDQDDDVDPSSIDIVFAGKSLKRKMKLESMKLDKDEVLNVFVQKVEDVLLMTAKALRFTREDLERDDDEYEYVDDEEEEEEEEDDDDDDS